MNDDDDDLTITITTLYPSGAIRISAIHDGRFVSHRYMGYSMSEAAATFIKEELGEEEEDEL